MNDIAMHQFNERLSGMSGAIPPYGVTRLHPNLAIASRPGPELAGPQSTEIKILWLDGTAIRMIDHIALHSEGAPLVASVVNELLIGVFSRTPEPKRLRDH